MTRFILIVPVILSACSSGTTDGFTIRSEPVTIPMFMNNLCLIFCTSALTTSGSKATTTGDGAVGGTQSNTQSNTQSATGGGVTSN